MQQFFAEPSWIRENKIYMQGADVNHIKNVLRMKPGEDVRVNDGRGKTYLCCISTYEEQTAVLDILKELDFDTELPSRLVLFQGLPKGTRWSGSYRRQWSWARMQSSPLRRSDQW